MKEILKSLRKLKNYNYILFIILILSFFLRFWGLGYSDFYGDETKTFYLDKTVPAVKFFMDQRKGPVQFGVVWFTEKITGGYDEFYTRIPFALAGVFSVLVLYLIVEKITNKKAALIATALFGLNGFFIAFSRTIQYQSFMILFGFLAIYFALLYQDIKNKYRLHYAVLSGVMLALSYLSHYDAVFFDIAIAFIFIKMLMENKDHLAKTIKEIITYFLLPAAVVTGLFYIPYVINGYYTGNTVNYVSRRLSGFEYGKNASWYTFWVYNPHSIWAFLTVFIIPFLLKRNDWDRNLLLFWFLAPFIAFQFIFSNPGTHTHNYFIPLIIIISVGIADFLKIIEKRINKQYFYAFLVYLFGLLFVVDLYTFIPGINKGYPWKNSNRYFTKVAKINKNYHLFLYGFPYDRNWDEMSEYILSEKRIRKIYTNDNDTIAKFYLRGLDYSKPGVNYLPEYFLYVFDNQEFIDIPTDMRIELDNRALEDVYDANKAFFTDGELTAILYKRNY